VVEPESTAPVATHALLTRASDPIQILLASGERRELHYWDSRLELGAGDEVRQGGRACAILEFAEGAHFRVEGLAIWRLQSEASASPRRLEFSELTKSADFHLGRSSVDTVLTLPGGNELAGRNARITVRSIDLRAFEVRNTGPEPVVARCPYLGGRIVTLAPGQRVLLPSLAEPSAYLAHLSHDASLFDDAHGRLVVQAPEQVELAASGGSIEVKGRGAITGIARACGARMVVTPGSTLRLTRAPLGTPRQREWED
jgi:hypothetical protein